MKKPNGHLGGRMCALLLVATMVFGILPTAIATDESPNGLLVPSIPNGRDSSYALAAEAEAASAKNGLQLWYDEPAGDGEWQTRSLPIGNSHMGVLTFGGVARERLHFSDKTLWTGGPNPVTPNGYNGGNRGREPSKPVVTAEVLAKQRALLADDSEKPFGEGSDPSGGSQSSLIAQLWGDTHQLGSAQDFGDLWVDFAPSGQTAQDVSQYMRKLDLNTGVSTVRYAYGGARYTREYFVNYPSDVSVFQFFADKDGLQSFDLEIELHKSHGTISKYTTEIKGNEITVQGYFNDNHLQFEAKARVLLEGGTLRNVGNTLQVRDADSVTVLMTTNTDYKNEYPGYRTGQTMQALDEQIGGVLNSAEGKGVVALKEEHIADHYALISRVDLNVGNSTENATTTDKLIGQYRAGYTDTFLDVLTFQFGRYLVIAASRDGTLPSNLQGVWGVSSSADGRFIWRSDWHLNVNVQMNYWPVYTTNLAECATPLIDYVSSLVAPGRVTASNSHNILSTEENPNGWITNCRGTPFGYTAGGENQEYGWNMAGAPWLLQNVYEDYRFTGNIETLKKTIYPTMREQVQFWDQCLVESARQIVQDEDSSYNGQPRLVVTPSISSEHGPTTEGTTYDQATVWQLYKETIEAANVLNVDQDKIAGWQEKMEKLDPINIGDDGQIKEWYEETHLDKAAKGGIAANGEIAIPNLLSGGHMEDYHRHISHLLGLFPGNLISTQTPEWLAAAIVSLEKRGIEYATGWGKANRINAWARTHESEQSYRQLQAMLRGKNRGMLDNLFNSHGTGSKSYNSASALFQIEGNYGFTAGVAEMLLQSHLGYVQALPALPQAWHTGAVKGLVARGNFVVDMQWADQKLSAMTITSRNGGEFKLEYPENTQPQVRCDGALVPLTTSNGMISFSTVAGKQYQLAKLPGSAISVTEDQVSVLRADDGVRLEWSAVANATGYVVYREKLKVGVPDYIKGMLYSDTGFERLSEVTATQYVDQDILPIDRCAYLVQAIVPQAAVSPTIPASIEELDMASLLVRARNLQARLTPYDAEALQKKIGLCITTAEEASAARAIMTAYENLETATMQGEQFFSLIADTSRAYALLEQFAPGELPWQCPATAYTALHEATERCNAIIDLPYGSFSGREMTLAGDQLANAVATIEILMKASAQIESSVTGQTLAVGAQVALHSEQTQFGCAIRFTTDGTAPNASSALYQVPLVLENSGAVYLRTRLFYGTEPVGKEFAFRYNNRVSSMTAASDLESYGGNFIADKTVDGDRSTRWAVKGVTTPSVLALALPQETAVWGVTVYIESLYRSRVQGYKLERSLDGENWDPLCEGGMLPADGLIFSAPELPVKARYLRFSVTELSGELTINEIEVDGAAAVATLSSQSSAELLLTKDAVLANDQLQAVFTARDETGAIDTTIMPTFHTSLTEDQSAWNGAALTLTDVTSNFEIWATYTQGGETRSTEKLKVVFLFSAVENLALGATGSAPSERNIAGNNEDTLAKHAIDGLMSSRWQVKCNANEPPYTGINWYQINFGTATTFDQIVLEEMSFYKEPGTPKNQQVLQNFILEASDDGQNWSEIFNTASVASNSYTVRQVGSPAGAKYGLPAALKVGDKQNKCVVDQDNGTPITAGHTVTLSQPQTAQYLKLTVVDVTAGNQTYSVSLHEFAVYDTDQTAQAVASMPVASLLSQSFVDKTEITLTTADVGATIYYTTDGTPATTDAMQYESPIVLTQSTTLRAIAVKENLAHSKEATYHYAKTVVPPDVPTVTVETPVADLLAGSYLGIQSVTLRGGDGASLRYTVDGSDPTKTHGRLYTGPIQLAVSKTLKVVSYAGDTISAVQEFAYTIAPQIGVESVALNRSSLALKIGDVFVLTASILPENASNKAVDWNSADSAIATVANGTVTALAAGEVTITATSKDGGKMGACSITITPRATGGSATQYTITVKQTDGGAISPATVVVQKGGSATFAIKPERGYIVKDVLVDSQSVGAVARYVFSNVAAGHTITAVFAKEDKPQFHFADVNKSDWFSDAVEYAVEAGLMNGTSDTTFAPNVKATRAMILTLLYRQAGSPNATGAGAWHEDAQKWALEATVSDGTNPEGHITREQLVTMLWRANDSPKTNATKLENFSDGAKVSAWAKDAVQWAVSAGILGGKGQNNLDPSGNATRAETAAMFMRLDRVKNA